jgi:hypothetical protein
LQIVGNVLLLVNIKENKNPREYPKFMKILKVKQDYSEEPEIEVKEIKDLNEDEIYTVINEILEYKINSLKSYLATKGFLTVEAIKEKKGWSLCDKDVIYYQDGNRMQYGFENLKHATLSYLPKCWVEVKPPQAMIDKIKENVEKLKDTEKEREAKKQERKLNAAKKLLGIE